MSYDEKTLKTDLEDKPVPQAYNPDIDDFEPIESQNRALKQIIYGPTGQPLSVVSDKLAVRATELEALMQGFATEGKLEQTRQELISAKDELALVKTELENIKTAMINGSQKVQSVGSIVGLLSERPEPQPENKGVTYWAVDTGEVAVSTGAEWRKLGVA